MKKLFVYWCLLLLSVGAVMAQQPVEIRKSPFQMAGYRHENTYLKVTYGRPHKNGREIFGKLVPYGQVWRTGANEATEITLTQPVKFGGKKLKAGTYTIFTIPNADTWTVILNREVGQWGAYKHEEKSDILRVEVPVQKIDTVYEPFTIEFAGEGKNVQMFLIWDNVKVAVPISW